MKTIKRIFIDDIIGLVKNFFALIIVIGICFLPALYAWFNIYSNWDPYGNTGALKIAAISLDKGFTDENGEYHNQGDTIIENLHENTAVNWQFVESSDEAIDGVYSGEYYAAVIIDEDFSYNMYNVLTEEVNRPTLLFYENQKKNPVATKISDTVVQSLQNNINVAFTEVVVSKAFTGASEVSEKIEEQGGVDAALAKLQSISDDLTNYQNTINQIIENDAQLQIALQTAENDANNLEQQAYDAANAVQSSANKVDYSRITLTTYTTDVSNALAGFTTATTDMSTAFENAANATGAADKAEKYKQALISAMEVEKELPNLPDEVGEKVTANIKKNIADQTGKIVESIKKLEEPLNQVSIDLSNLISQVQEAPGIKDIGAENIQKLVDYGIISQDQADNLVNGLDDSLEQTIRNEAINGLVEAKNNVDAEIENIDALTEDTVTTVENQVYDAIDDAQQQISSYIKIQVDQEKIQSNIDKLNQLNPHVLALIGEDKLDSAISEGNASVREIARLVGNDLTSNINDGLINLTDTLNNSNALLNSVGQTFGNIGVMFEAIGNTVDCANTSLQQTNEAISYVNGRLIEVIDEVENAAGNDKIKVLENALTGDPEIYGKFFSTPVEVETEAVYPIENYGSAVAPFYSTLAFWVGALILTAIIKIEPDKKKYPDASESQLYFGRYVLYWVLGQVQAVVIVLGDLFLLHVQCVHPWLFMLAASVIATTFTILIYSLVTTWGDAGKALAVVIVVIQIAGSSGTYPIELLPDFFKKVYIFFPFPYAINAIRECLCGMYKLDYLKYLGCLGIFMIVSLIIGLLIRIPFEPINHYMEERMKDTDMM